MNPKNQTAFSTIGVMSASDTPPVPLTGLHEGLAVTLQRIAQVNALLDGALQRIHGPRPVSVSAQQGKNPETPSIVALASRIDSELAFLEGLASDVCKFIG